MKKLVALIICLCTVLSLSACGINDNEPITLTILMESTAESKEDAFKRLAQIANPGKEIILNFEYLDYDLHDSAERETQLANYRSAIMAGEGPDIFILPSWNPQLVWDDEGNGLRIEPLFPDIEDAMANNIFYPLDDMIAESEILNMEDHYEVIMDAGKTDDGQMVLPLLFEYELLWLEREKMLDFDVADSDFNSLLNDEDNYVKFEIGSNTGNWLYRAYTDYVDESGQSLAFSQDELLGLFRTVSTSLDWIHEFSDEYVEYDEDGFPIIKEWEENGPARELNENGLLHLNRNFDIIYPLAVPSYDGGICAQINAFTAINRNTEHPQEAFNIIQYLFGEEMQTRGKIVIDDGEIVIPLGPEMNWIGAIEMDGIKTGKFNYTEKIYDNCWESLADINSRITSARFTSEIDTVLYDFYDKNYFGIAPDDETLVKLVEELYSRCQMIAAE